MNAAERFNWVSHLAGAVLAVAGTAVLVTWAALDGDPRRIVSYSIYGATLILLYLFSTLYHGTRGRAKRVLRVFDHQAIYLLIAGTYTPFALVGLGDATGWWLFGAVWGLAALGMVMEALPRRPPRALALALYLGMGWLCVPVLEPVRAALGAAGFGWLLAGGLLYSAGVAFYVLGRRHAWGHGLWHLFVLAGSCSHYVAIFAYL